jgi:hypothetical protein
LIPRGRNECTQHVKLIHLAPHRQIHEESI